MEKTYRGKSLPGGEFFRSERDVWVDCVKVILSLLEDSLPELETTNQLGYRTEYTRELCDKTNRFAHASLTHGQGWRSSSPSGSITNATKRKRSSFLDCSRDRKMQRISSSLANDIARSLTMSDSNSNANNNSEDNDIIMGTYSSSPNPRQSPLSSPQLCRKIIASNRRFSPSPSPCNTNGARRFTGSKGSFSQGLQPSQTMDFEEWLKTQAHRQNLNLLEYRQLFNEKQKQLHQYLSEIDTADHTKTDLQRYNTIKENLEQISKIINELNPDQSMRLSDISPEWKIYEGHVQRVALYIQAIEDMKQLSGLTFPRTRDLLTDIQRLQDMLETKITLYGENLVQNGLEWKAMGLPVDEQLMAMVKGWFYNLSIGLLSELDMECSRLRSLVNDMRELIQYPDGEKLMESIACGIEFISGITSLTGLPSKKLTYGCRVLATFYGQWVSENLEALNEAQLAKTQSFNPAAAGDKTDQPMDVKMTHTTTRQHARLDIRFMQMVDNMVRVLSSLQSLQEVHITNSNILGSAGKSTTSHGWDVLGSTTAHLHPDTEMVTVLENLTSTLVEISVRALAVIETSQNRSGGANNGTHMVSKHANIMSNPIMSILHMEGTVLTFVEKIVELAGREGVDGWRVQRLHAHLETIEANVCI
ncbi:hypothetical protein BX666DRAFT_1975658 [Dichotomocladium elegans]|nr:hypothetical protein BX666DRAFT_1975658 [Dichotomocladium elegans]